MAATTAPVSAPSKMKRLPKAIGAAVLSAGLVGTFALPAYASNDGHSEEMFYASAYESQSIETDADISDESLDAELEVAKTSNDPDMIAEIERKKREREAAKQAEQQSESASDDANYSGTDIPAGKGAEGIVNAALAQKGIRQDCTALVEKALRAVGIPAGDLGTQVGEYTALGGSSYAWGTQDPAPGDILVWPGVHVSVYLGNGMHVDAGFSYAGGSGVRTATAWGKAPAYGVRF